MSGRWRGRTALVTGASSGVGLEIARALARDGARVILPVRDRARGEAAAARIRETVPEADLALRDLDLTRLASVATLAEDLVAEQTPIDLYVMNAGIVLLGDRERHVTEDDFELHFQTNFLGHFALTLGLLPLLRAGDGRIAVQGSLAAARSRLDWNDLQTERRYNALRAYGRSKLALCLFGRELARRSAAADWRLRVSLCHPGISPDTGIAPGIREQHSGGVGHALAARLGGTPAQAALPALMALSTDAASGRFYGPSGAFGLAGPPRELRLPHALADDAAAHRVWRAAEQLPGIAASSDR